MPEVNEEINTPVFPAPKPEAVEKEGFGIWDSKYCCYTAKDACVTVKGPLRDWPAANQEVVWPNGQSAVSWASYLILLGSVSLPVKSE